MCYALHRRHSFARYYVSTPGYTQVQGVNGERESVIILYQSAKSGWRNVLISHIAENNSSLEVSSFSLFPQLTHIYTYKPTLNVINKDKWMTWKKLVLL